MRDKDVSLMLKALLPAASTMVMTEPDTPRAHTAEELAAIARKLSPAAADRGRARSRARARARVDALPGGLRSGIDLSRRRSPRSHRRGRARSADASLSRRSRRLRAAKADVILRKPAFFCSVRMTNLFRGTLAAVALLLATPQFAAAQLTDIPASTGPGADTGASRRQPLPRCAKRSR